MGGTIKGSLHGHVGEMSHKMDFGIVFPHREELEGCLV